MTDRFDTRDPALVAAWSGFFEAVERPSTVFDIGCATLRLSALGADPYRAPPPEYDEPGRHGGAGKGEQ